MRAWDVRSPRVELAARSVYLRSGACVKGKAHPLAPDVVAALQACTSAPRANRANALDRVRVPLGAPRAHDVSTGGMRSGSLYVITRIMRSIFERGEVRTPLHLLLGPVCLFVTATLVRAATFNVTSTMDAIDASPGDGICASAGSQCTLRAAVQGGECSPWSRHYHAAGRYLRTHRRRCL